MRDTERIDSIIRNPFEDKQFSLLFFSFFFFLPLLSSLESKKLTVASTKEILDSIQKCTVETMLFKNLNFIFI